MERLGRLVPAALAAIVLLAACDDGRPAPPPELPELAARLDEVALAAAIPEPTAAPGPSEDRDRAPPSLVGALVTIGATGGDGVSLRSACRADARIAGGWADGTELEVIEVGAVECEGWTLVEARGVSSWVSNQYLPGLGAAAEVRAEAEAQEEEGSGAEAEDAAAVRAWVGALDEASGRIALIARSATGSSLPQQADFLRVIARDAGQLAAAAAAAPVATFSAACGGAAVVLAGAAETLRIVAEQLAALFDGWPATPYPVEVDRLAGQYASLAGEAAPMAAGCLAPGAS